MSKRWVAFFSQSGSEINAVSKQLGFYPHICITNKSSLDDVNSELKTNTTIVRTNKKLTEEDYVHLIGYPTNTIVTLNGWLRIVPRAICETYTVYNGHPGLITKYPELKGKDPQQKAIILGLETSGCVIHKVIPEVDSGSILAEEEVSIKGLEVSEVFAKLHNTSVKLWVNFLKTELL